MPEQNKLSEKIRSLGRNIIFEHRLVRYAFILFFILSIGGVVTIYLAKSERGVQYPHNRTIGLQKIYQNVLRNAGVLGTGVCACQPDRVEQIIMPGGFETTIHIYDEGGSGPRPGIVLIHGNVWNGQNLSTYRLIAELLSREGFIVLTLDKVGFGKSDDPFGKGPEAVAAAYDRVGQVNEVVKYLREKTDVDQQNITLFGHSGGVSQAMELGAASNKIANVVIFVAPHPPPKNEQQAQQHSNNLNNRFSNRYKILYGKPIPEWFEWEMTGIVEQDPDIMWQYFREDEHKPLVLVLGEQDEPEGHPHVLSIFDSLSEPKELAFIDRSDHYLLTAQSLYWIFYDKEVARQLVDKLVPLLKDQTAYEGP